MGKILAYTKENLLHGESHLLECCICKENDREKLLIEDLGIAIGMAGYNYSFCKSCWNSKSLGKKLLDFFDYPGGMKIKDDSLTLKEIS